MEERIPILILKQKIKQHGWLPQAFSAPSHFDKNDLLKRNINFLEILSFFIILPKFSTIKNMIQRKTQLIKLNSTGSRELLTKSIFFKKKHFCFYFRTLSGIFSLRLSKLDFEGPQDQFATFKKT